MIEFAIAAVVLTGCAYSLVTTYLRARREQDLYRREMLAYYAALRELHKARMDAAKGCYSARQG